MVKYAWTIRRQLCWAVHWVSCASGHLYAVMPVDGIFMPNWNESTPRVYSISTILKRPMAFWIIQSGNGHVYALQGLLCSLRNHGRQSKLNLGASHTVSIHCSVESNWQAPPRCLSKTLSQILRSTVFPLRPFTNPRLSHAISTGSER